MTLCLQFDKVDLGYSVRHESYGFNLDSHQSQALLKTRSHPYLTSFVGHHR